MATFAEDAVRTVALEGFARIGVAPSDIDCFEEEILIRDGRQMARTYRAGECAAMWLIPVNLLQFYHRDGEMLLTVDLWERLAPPVAPAGPIVPARRMAA